MFSLLVGWLADTLRILIRLSVQSAKAAMKGVKWLAVGLVVTISLYGFSWAAIIQRLP